MYTNIYSNYSSIWQSQLTSAPQCARHGTHIIKDSPGLKECKSKSLLSETNGKTPINQWGWDSNLQPN